MMNINDNIVKTRIKTADAAFRKVINGLFDRHLPCDRILSDFFRAEKKCGSKDRAYISKIIFAILRHWGTIRVLLPKARIEELESGIVSMTHRDTSALFTIALLLDNARDDAKTICQLSEISLGDEYFSSKNGIENWAKLLNANLQEITSAIPIPKWAQELIPQNEQAPYFEKLKTRPPLWLRVAGNKEKVIAELKSTGVEFQCHNKIGNAIAVYGTLNLRSLETFNKGEFEIQDLASQCIGLLTNAKAGERWFDPCAGAGGKSLQLAAMMERKGRILSGDIREKALEELKLRARRADYPNISTKVHDGGPWKGKHQFDGVLVDAPCSGSGVWRRNPGNQWLLTSEDVDNYAKTQLQVLENFALAVAPGKTLVYATCSVFTKENEDVVAKFLERNPTFKPAQIIHPLTGEEIHNGMMRVSPLLDNCDAMFACKFVKEK